MSGGDETGRANGRARSTRAAAEAVAKPKPRQRTTRTPKAGRDELVTRLALDERSLGEIARELGLTPRALAERAATTGAESALTALQHLTELRTAVLVSGAREHAARSLSALLRAGTFDVDQERARKAYVDVLKLASSPPAPVAMPRRETDRSGAKGESGSGGVDQEPTGDDLSTLLAALEALGRRSEHDAGGTRDETARPTAGGGGASP